MALSTFKFSVILTAIILIFIGCGDDSTGIHFSDGDMEGDTADLMDVQEYPDGPVPDGDFNDSIDNPEDIDGDIADIEHMDTVDDPNCLPGIEAPEEVDFGINQYPGHIVVREIELRNTGCADLSLYAVKFDETIFTPEFMLLDNSVNEQSPYHVAPGETYIISVAYTSMDAGEDESTLYVLSDDREKGIIEISLISHAPPSRLCYTVLDGDNARDLDDGILEIGVVDIGETKSRTVRMWNCAPGEFGGLLTINNVTITKSGDAFDVANTMPEQTWSLIAMGMDVPPGPCTNSQDCVDLRVAYTPTDWVDIADPETAQIEVTYNSSYGSDNVFSFSATGSVDYAGLKIFPLEPGCDNVKFGSTYYLGYVLRNDSPKDFLVLNTYIFYPVPGTSELAAQLYRRSSGVILKPGDEHVLIVKYEPHAAPDIDNRLDGFNLRVDYCDMANEDCYAENPDSSSISRQQTMLRDTCQPRQELDPNELPNYGAFFTQCGDSLTIYAIPPEDTPVCGHTWTWVEKPEGSTPELHGTQLGIPEDQWDSVVVELGNKVGLYLLAEQIRDCSSGQLHYNGLFAFNMNSCMPHLKLNMSIDNCNGEARVDMLFRGPNDYECSQQIMEIPEGGTTGICLDESMSLTTLVMETSPQCSENRMIVMTTTELPDGMYSFCAELLNACDDSDSVGNCMETVAPHAAITLFADRGGYAGTFNESLGSFEADITDEHTPRCWSLPLELGEWGDIAPLE